MERSALHQYIASKGFMTRTNPEILRLSNVTGFSTEHIYRVVLGERVPAQKCAIALVGALRDRVDLTVDSLVDNSRDDASTLNQG